jgi:hypothetical protein
MVRDVAFGLGLLSTRLAHAADGPLMGLAQAAADFLIKTLGPVVFLIGLAMTAYSIIFGNRDGLQRAFTTLVAGGLLFSAEYIMRWLQNVSH